MTANQRRPGFRLPWSSETDGPSADGEPAAPGTEAASPASAPAPVEPAAEAATSTNNDEPETGSAASPAQPDDTSEVQAPSPAVEDAAAEAEAAAAPVAETAPAPAREAAQASGGTDFMRDLVAAMRRVADEARETSVSELRARADEQVHSLEADAEQRREELRAHAEADVAGVGEWAKAEAERIKAEAEARVVARRAQLDQQLAGETTRSQAETKALRDRVAEYERELAAYHAQLAEINDPAAFAAAAKRMPPPPALQPAAAAMGSAAPEKTVAASDDAPVQPATGASNGVPSPAPEVHPAEEEVLAARLAELDASLAEPEPAAVATSAEPVTTEVVVKGLGSFGAITGFRQALSGVDGIDGVALSLGQTGEFVFRATHSSGFDVRSAITTLEGDGAKVEDRPEGGLRVTLDRAR